MKKLYNAKVIKEDNKITINIVLLKCLYIEGIKVWSNIVFAYKCLKFNEKWAKQTNWLVDSMLLTVTCTRDEVDIKPHVMYIVKPRMSRKATTEYMLGEVEKLYRQLKRMQQLLSERGEVYVTSWGIPLNETELADIMKLLEK